MRTEIDEHTMTVARDRVAKQWIDKEKWGKFLIKNVDIVVGYGHFNQHQDGYQALAMIRAFAETLCSPS